MKQANRIVLNTMASYGRSLFAMVLGLFSARWVLAALGKQDLGLFGLMGSCLVFVTLLNGILGGTISRFYAYAIGEQQRIGKENGRETMIRWFNAAFSIHAFLPLILFAAIYPIGIYALQHWLIIPGNRVEACVWVFRMVLISACIHMASVPYVAMYRAYQLIAELSIWETLRTILTFICAYLLLEYRYDRLIAYAVYMTIIPSAISIAQMLRARITFDACIIKRKYLFDISRLKPMFTYAFGDMFGSLGAVVRDNGTTFLINMNFGPSMNASFGIAHQVTNHTTALSSAMIGALVPAVTTAEGTGNHEYAMRLAFRSIKFGVGLILLFCIPLVIEIDEVLRLWLVNPPEGAATLCCCMLIAFVCHKLGWGHHLVILAKGRVVGAQTLFGITAMTGVLLSWLFIHLKMGIWGVGLSYILIYSAMTIERVFCAKLLCGMSIRFWILRIVVPIFVVTAISFGAGMWVSGSVSPSLWRIFLTAGVSNSVLFLGMMAFVLDFDEKMFVRKTIIKILRLW